MRIFVSAVTNEFGKARDSVASDLRARGHEVKVQSDFTQGGDAEFLLERLHDYIRDCTAVVCIIGKRTANLPPPGKALRFAKMLPTSIAEASYTQWEFFFARHYRRRLYTYLANDDYVPDEATPTDSHFPALQTAFVEHIKAENAHWTPFSNADQLGRAVLRENWTESSPPPPATPVKPVVLPYPSLGPLFKGREGFMQDLAARLTSPDGKTVVIGKPEAFYGLGGVGKTRAAVEYAWAHQDDYSALLFVVAETPEALRANLVALTATLAPHLNEAPDDARLAAVIGWLRSNPGWLVILDNVDSRPALAAVEGLLKELHKGQLLVTSRLSDFPAYFAPLPLDVLSLDDAVAFLLDRTEGRRRNATDDEAKAREIASEVDRLALALEQAAAYIAKRRLTFEAYLEQWRAADHSKVLDWFDETVTGYKRAVAVTWQTSVEQLGEPGRRLLERLAWLAPEPVPEFLLDVPIPGAKDENLHEAVDDLAAYSLITRDAEAPFFLVHRLVQDVTQRNFNEKKRRQCLEETLAWIEAAFRDEPDDVRSWPRSEPLAPHVRAILIHADSAAIANPTALLMNQLGVLLNAKALYAEAELLFRGSLAIRERELGPDHPEISTALNNLAVLYRIQGRYVDAEPLFRRSLAIREKASGPDHPTIGVALNNLALLYRMQGRYAEAEPLFQRDLAISEKTLGAAHPNISITLNNLAGLYQLQGRLAEAEPLFQRSLAIREHAFGPSHPAVGTLLNNLAELYREQGRDVEAEPLYQRDLSISEKALGPNHPSVAISLNNLASLYHAQGRYAEAEPLHLRSIDIFRSISGQIGRQDPNLEPAVRNYTNLLKSLGKTQDEIKAERQRLMHWDVQ